MQCVQLKNKIKFSYQDVDFATRRKEADYVIGKYADRLPVICEVLKSSSSNITLDRNKYLIPRDLTIGQFMHVIRKRINLLPSQGLFIFTETITMPGVSERLESIYANQKNTDGFMYLALSGENTYG